MKTNRNYQHWAARYHTGIVTGIPAAMVAAPFIFVAGLFASPTTDRKDAPDNGSWELNDTTRRHLQEILDAHGGDVEKSAKWMNQNNRHVEGIDWFREQFKKVKEEK